jgi:hypothetical protein
MDFELFDIKFTIYDVFLLQFKKLGKIGKHEDCLRVAVGTKEMNSLTLC